MELAVEDERRISRLVGRYADAVSRADAVDWEATWAPDATWQMDQTLREGRAAIVELWTRARANYDSIIHLVGHGTVRATPAGAEGQWLVMEILRRVGEAHDRLQVTCYQDQYASTDDGWVFARRRLTVHYRGTTARGEFLPLARFPAEV